MNFISMIAVGSIGAIGVISAIALLLWIFMEPIADVFRSNMINLINRQMGRTDSQAFDWETLNARIDDLEETLNNLEEEINCLKD